MASQRFVRSAALRLERALIVCADDQFGVFTTAQALAAGVSHNALTERMNAGLISRVHQGVYRSNAVAPSRLQDLLAAGMAVPGSALCGTSAGQIHELPIGSGFSAAAPSLLVRYGRSHGYRGITVRRTRRTIVTQPWHGSSVTTASATLVDLVGLLRPDVFRRCLDHAIANRLVSVPRMLADVGDLTSSRLKGRALLIRELETRSNWGPSGSVVHRSRVEQNVARWLRASALPPALSNYAVAVHNGRPIEVDFAWPAAKVALEISPFFTHGSAATQLRDMERRRTLVESNWRIVEASDVHLADALRFGPILSTLAVLIGM